MLAWDGSLLPKQALKSVNKRPLSGGEAYLVRGSCGLRQYAQEALEQDHASGPQAEWEWPPRTPTLTLTLALDSNPGAHDTHCSTSNPAALTCAGALFYPGHHAQAKAGCARRQRHCTVCQWTRQKTSAPTTTSPLAIEITIHHVNRTKQQTWITWRTCAWLCLHSLVLSIPANGG